MNESEWLSCTSPAPLLDHARGQLNDRKLRLFACACCRRIWHLLDDRCRATVRLAEQFADGAADREQLEQVCRDAYAAIPSSGQRQVALAAAVCAMTQNIRSAALSAASLISEALRAAVSDPQSSADIKAWNAERKAQAALVREIVRNPFLSDNLPLRISPTAGRLAAAMYHGEDCGFALHDALAEENHKELMLHFQTPAHPKGCWALDFILRRTQTGLS